MSVKQTSSKSTKKGASRHQVWIDVPNIEPEMCGHCRNWTVREDEETGICAVLVAVRGKGERVKRRIPDKDTLWSGKLERMAHERTMAATEGWHWVEEGSGRIDAAENWTDVPRFFYEVTGEKRTVWEPLETHEWGSCSRHEARKQRAA